MSPAPAKTPPRLTEYGFAAGFLIWSFRACAAGRSHCRVINEGYERAFSHDAAIAMTRMRNLVKIFGAAGQRRINLGAPGILYVTHDELSLIAAFSAAQSNRDEERDAHLRWLLACDPGNALTKLVNGLAGMFLCHDLKFKQLAAPAEPVARTLPRVIETCSAAS